MDTKTIIETLKKEKENLNKEAEKFVKKKQDNYELLEKMASIDLVINELEKWQ